MPENIDIEEGQEKEKVKEDVPKYEISKFKLSKILNNNSVRKSIALLGTFPDQSETDRAIILFEKQAFTESEVQTDFTTNDTNGTEISTERSYFTKDLKVQTEFINNIYGSFTCVPHSNLNGIKTTVVYPATDKHIEKYSICQKFLINETPDLYRYITCPYITSSQFSLDWVYNILEHKQETDRIIFEDDDPENGFVLLPDLKWDGRNVENLYVLAICHKREIKSLRDLSEEHLPLLRNIRQKAAEAIEKKYEISSTQLRMYIHYQPSFYHLHVHINLIRNDAPGIWCEKSHILDTVINNIELMSDYYKRATLPFVLYDGNKLLEKFEEEIEVRKRRKCSNQTLSVEKTSGD